MAVEWGLVSIVRRLMAECGSSLAAATDDVRPALVDDLRLRGAKGIDLGLVLRRVRRVELPLQTPAACGESAGVSDHSRKDDRTHSKMRGVYWAGRADSTARPCAVVPARAIHPPACSGNVELIVAVNQGQGIAVEKSWKAVESQGKAVKSQRKVEERQ